MQRGAGRHAALAEELAEWWEDLWQRGIGSRVVLVPVPPGWGRTTVLDQLEAEITSRDDAPVTLTVRVNGRELPDETGLQAAVLRDCLAAAGKRHRVAELLGLDRLGGTAQLSLGVGGLFAPGLPTAVSFLLAGIAAGGAGKAWDDSPAGQDGAVARAARAVAAVSTSVPVVVIIDDADCVDLDLGITLVEHLAARHNGHVLVVVAVDPDSALAAALTSRARFGITEGLVLTADADPGMGYQSRTDLVLTLRPHLPAVAARRIARRTTTFAEVFAITASARLSEVSAEYGEAGMLPAVDAVINARLQRTAPSAEAVVVAWTGGLLHARQVGRALDILGAGRDDNDQGVQRRESLARLADPASPRPAEQVGALPARDRHAMAAVVLDEALTILADPEMGLVDRVVAMQAAHRVRSDLPGRDQLPRAQAVLVACLEALGDQAAALKVATEALSGWPPGARYQAERDSLTAAVVRLARTSPLPSTELLVEELVAAAVAGGAATGLEARVWAAVDLLDSPGQRETALALVGRITADLNGRADLGASGDRWRLLLAFHAGRAGHPAITERLLAPMLSSRDPGQFGAAHAVLSAVSGPGADIRLQIIVLEAELAALPPGADDDRLRLHQAIAANHATLGDYRQALAHGQSELALQEQIYGGHHRHALRTRSYLAVWTAQCGDDAGALRQAQELLPAQQRVLGPSHHITLTTRSNIAGWTGECREPAAALRLYQELLPDMERAIGPHHPDTLAIRGNLATWTGRCGDPARALRLYQELLGDRERLLGPGHPDTLATRGNLADWTGELGDCAGALRLYQELLPDQELVLGPAHPDILATRGNIATWTARCGDTAEAMRLSRELLPDEEQILGPQHPQTLITRRSAAALTSLCGDSPEALRLFRDLLPDQEQVLSSCHPDTLVTRGSIATLTGRCGDSATALRLNRELLPDQQSILGPDHPDTLATRDNIAFWTGMLGNADGALRLFRELLPDKERVLGPNHPDTVATRSNIVYWTSQGKGGR